MHKGMIIKEGKTEKLKAAKNPKGFVTKILMLMMCFLVQIVIAGSNSKPVSGTPFIFPLPSPAPAPQVACDVTIDALAASKSSDVGKDIIVFVGRTKADWLIQHDMTKTTCQTAYKGYM